jgi:hypothetical protein
MADFGGLHVRRAGSGSGSGLGGVCALEALAACDTVVLDPQALTAGRPHLRTAVLGLQPVDALALAPLLHGQPQPQPQPPPTPATVPVPVPLPPSLPSDLLALVQAWLYTTDTPPLPPPPAGAEGSAVAVGREWLDALAPLDRAVATALCGLTPPRAPPPAGSPPHPRARAARPLGRHAALQGHARTTAGRGAAHGTGPGPTPWALHFPRPLLRPARPRQSRRCPPHNHILPRKA